MSIHVYGPVPSRRLGRSLGIDVTPPLPNKTCNFNCVYCQLGRTRHFTNQRREFFPVNKLIEETENRIELVGIANFDFLTIVGDGEPTLITAIKEKWNIPVCVITNGALMCSEQVRNELLDVDVILPTLDAGTEQEFKRINRPIRHIQFEKMVNGMIEFRKSFTGQLWGEFMAVKGINDSFESLHKTREIYEKIEPDRIYVNTPIRPPCEDWVQTPSLENIQLIQDILSPTAKDGLISINLSEQGEFFIEGNNETEIIKNLVNTIKRHPMRLDQVESVLEKKQMQHPEEILKRIFESHIKKKEFQGKVFFTFFET
jgi:wyosine [tRNA(Phe)-imidazoG37] synthetase (radical SAM superfamily)